VKQKSRSKDLDETMMQKKDEYETVNVVVSRARLTERKAMNILYD
jgi:DNA-directed RNA polymerase subunit K/omega